MHPIFASRRGIGLYLAGWIPLVALAIVLIVKTPQLAWRMTMALAIPLAAIQGFISLAAWYPCRAVSLRTASLGRVIATHVIGSVMSSALWVGVALTMAQTLAPILLERVFNVLAILFILGVILYVLSVALHYLLMAIDASREAESRALESRVLAREAELRLLRSQIDPHFLFNSLNTIGSLCGSDAVTARSMSLLLADFLRSSLRFGSEERIPLLTEFLLAKSYLAIERIRFGERLTIDEALDDSAKEYRVPPLLLQPLVENAVNHGIGHLVAGGTIRIGATQRNGQVEIYVENECDPDRPPSKGAGIGIRNVQQRLESIYGRAARVDRSERDGVYRVQLTLPMQEEPVNR